MSVYTVTINGESYTVHLKGRRGTELTFIINSTEYTVSVQPSGRLADLKGAVVPLAQGSQHRSTSSSPLAASPDLKAPLPGIISDVKVSVGDAVSAGTTLIVIEAMKMENPIKAPRDVTIKSIHVTKGQEVAHGVMLVSFDV